MRFRSGKASASRARSGSGFGPVHQRRGGQASVDTSAIYRFKIVLQDSHPVIWRRIETKDVMLEQLHALIQTAMGWTDSHLHLFEIAGVRYADRRFMMDGWDDFGAIDYRGLRVSDLIAKHGAKLRMRYEYDFGDGWEHQVVLEKVTKPEQGIRYPRCIDGARPVPRKISAEFTVSPNSSRRSRTPVTPSTTTTWRVTARSIPRRLTRQKPLGA